MNILKSAARPFVVAFSAASILFVAGAFAVTQYPAAVDGALTPVLMWLNGTGQAVPASAANPLPVTVNNAASITIGSVYLKDAGGVNQAAVNAAGQIAVQPSPALTYTNIPTSTNTVVKAAPGTFGGLSVNTAGTLSSAIVYDHATCTGSIIGTFSTTAVGSVIFPPDGIAALTGICVTTVDTGGAANITVFWR